MRGERLSGVWWGVMGLALAAVVLPLGPGGCATPVPPGADNSAAPDAGEFRRITVTGVGSNQEQAVKNALFSAVEQVVGSLVDVDITTGGDKVLGERIRTLSDGCVQSYTMVGIAPPSNGVVAVVLEADVARTVLLSRLADSDMPLKKEVQADALYARAITQNRVKEQAAELLAPLLAKAQQTFEVTPVTELEVIPAGELTAEQVPFGTTWCRIRLRLTANATGVTQSQAPKLVRVLDEIALNKRRLRGRVEIREVRAAGPMTVEQQLRNELIGPGWRPDRENHWIPIVLPQDLMKSRYGNAGDIARFDAAFAPRILGEKYMVMGAGHGSVAWDGGGGFKTIVGDGDITVFRLGDQLTATCVSYDLPPVYAQLVAAAGRNRQFTVGSKNGGWDLQLVVRLTDAGERVVSEYRALTPGHPLVLRESRMGVSGVGGHHFVDGYSLLGSVQGAWGDDQLVFCVEQEVLVSFPISATLLHRVKRVVATLEQCEASASVRDE